MKKIFPLLFILLVSILTQAQQLNKVTTGIKKSVGRNNSQLNCKHINSHTIQSVPFFSEDFSGGIPAGWSNVDSSGNNVLWRPTTTGAYNTGASVDEQLSTSGTTASNGYLILDSDSAGLGVTENSNLTTVAINCSGHNVVHLTFNEFFAQYGTSTGTVRVSNNNINWTNIHSAEAGLAQDDGTANPFSLDIDISSVAANQSTVYIRFTYTGNYDYWWFVDDVQLFEPSSIDLAASYVSSLDSEYTQVPRSQAGVLTLYAEVKNTGLNAIPSGAATAIYEIINTTTSATVFTETINLGTINLGAIVSITPSNTFTPLVAGLHKARLTVSVSGDGDATNDMIESAKLLISDSVYARDDGIVSGIFPIGAGAGGDGMVGLKYKVSSADKLTSVTFFLSDTLTQFLTGTPLYVTILSQASDTTNPDETNILATSDTLMVASSTVSAGGTYFTLPIQNGGVQLSPGLYFVALHEVDSLMPFGVTNSVFTNNSVWVHFIGIPSPPAINDWARIEDFGFNPNPMYILRANFGHLLTAIEKPQSASSLNVFPNPSGGMITLQVDIKNENCRVEVYDISGRLVYHTERLIDNNVRIDITDQLPGIYSLKFITKNKIETKMICIAGR